MVIQNKESLSLMWSSARAKREGINKWAWTELQHYLEGAFQTLAEKTAHFEHAQS